MANILTHHGQAIPIKAAVNASGVTVTHSNRPVREGIPQWECDSHMHYHNDFLELGGQDMRTTSIAVLAMTIGLLAGNAQAADISQTCLDIVEGDGQTNGATAAACACVAEKVGDNADLIANIEQALATPSGPDREAVYSPEVLGIVEACGPWE